LVSENRRRSKHQTETPKSASSTNMSNRVNQFGGNADQVNQFNGAPGINQFANNAQPVNQTGDNPAPPVIQGIETDDLGIDQFPLTSEGLVVKLCREICSHPTAFTIEGYLQTLHEKCDNQVGLWQNLRTSVLSAPEDNDRLVDWLSSTGVVEMPEDKRRDAVDLFQYVRFYFRSINK
jgi:hypothetical protein